MRCLDSITDSMDMNLSKLQEIAKDREAWHAPAHGVVKSDIVSTVSPSISHEVMEPDATIFVF